MLYVCFLTGEGVHGTLHRIYINIVEHTIHDTSNNSGEKSTLK
jgi:hypothetical protein